MGQSFRPFYAGGYIQAAQIDEYVEFVVGWTSLLRHAGFTVSQQS